MISSKWLVALICTSAAIALTNCQNSTSQSPSPSPSDTAASPTPTPSAEAQVEKSKPAPGTGNVQGKVMYNGEPAANIEVKLCEKFSQFVGGCDGKTYTARTDKNGEYVITNVEPKVYEALLARVFDTDSYIFATSGAIGVSAAEYEVTTDKTLFVSTTHLFKSDLKLLSPKAGSTISAQNLELKWNAYPDAAYYKFSIYADDPSVISKYINERVEATSFSLPEPLQKGTYRWQVEAYNSNDQKLAESSDDIKFTIK
ncbi:MAG TPA: hypothetical protein V6C78_12155 [Crinalium sp.]|jgi:hypothetical protein